MEKNLLDLPPETREHILSFCKVADVVNLACCNKEYHNQFKYWLFSRLSINWNDLTASSTLLEKRYKYMKFTKSIKFENRRCHNTIPYPRSRYAPPWSRISRNCIRLLNQCDKLNKLRIHNASGTALKRIVRTTKNLKHLDLRSSFYLHILFWKELSGLPLETLSLRYCELSDDALHIISKLNQVKELSICCCDGFTGKGISYIGGMTQLNKLAWIENERTVLMTYNTDDDGDDGDDDEDSDEEKNEVELFQDISWLAKLKNLTNLRLKCIWGWGTRLDSDDFNLCSSSTKLESLMLRDTNLKDRALSSLPSLVSLLKLDLGCNKFLTDVALKYVGNCRSLTELNLGGCKQISDKGVHHLNALPLKILRLNGCILLTDTCLEKLKITTLNELYLSGCIGINDSGLFHLREMYQLKKLNVYGLKITDVGLMHLAVLQLKQLSIKVDKDILSTDGVNQFCKHALMVIEPILYDNSMELRFINVFDCSYRKALDMSWFTPLPSPKGEAQLAD